MTTRTPEEQLESAKESAQRYVIVLNKGLLPYETKVDLLKRFMKKIKSNHIDHFKKENVPFDEKHIDEFWDNIFVETRSRLTH